jgi:hypothetical protein
MEGICHFHAPVGIVDSLSLHCISKRMKRREMYFWESTKSPVENGESQVILR